MSRPSKSRRSQPSYGRKSLQLCKQVSRALTFGFSECDDDVIRELYVESVLPAPDDSRLMVTVTPMSEGMDSIQILTRLGEATPFLRGQVAEAITRKKTPELYFQCLPHPADRVTPPE